MVLSALVERYFVSRMRDFKLEPRILELLSFNLCIPESPGTEDWVKKSLIIMKMMIMIKVMLLMIKLFNK